MTVGIGCIGVSVQQKLTGSAADRRNVNTVLIVTNVVVRGSVVEEVFAVGKEKWPAMGIVLRVGGCHGNGLASGSGDPVQAGGCFGSTYDDAVRASASTS